MVMVCPDGTWWTGTDNQEAMMNMSEFVGMNAGSLASDVDDHVLLKEMSHRINNEYACAINVVCLRASKSPNAELRTALADVATLLMQFADIHRALTFP